MADQPEKTAKKRILIQGLGTIASRILGLVRDLLVAAMFPRAVTDAWALAFRIPNFFRRVMGEGGIGMTLIPALNEGRNFGVEANEHTADPADSEARKLKTPLWVHSFQAWVVLMTSAFVFVYFYFAERWLAWFQVPAEHFQLTLKMTQIMAVFVLLITQYSYFLARWHHRGAFLRPALAPVLFNIVMIVSIFFAKQRPENLALGVVLGALIQLMFVAEADAQTKGDLRSLRIVFRGMLSRPVLALVLKSIRNLFAISFWQWSILVTLFFSTSLGEGIVSSFYWADRLLELPLSLIAVNIGASFFPELSARTNTSGSGSSASSNSLDVDAETLLRQKFSWTLALLTPMSIGLFVLAEPIVNLLFKRGEFGTRDVSIMVQILKYYAWILLAAGLTRIAYQALFARNQIAKFFILNASMITLVGIIVQTILLSIFHKNLVQVLQVTLCAHVVVVILSGVSLSLSFSYFSRFKKILVGAVIMAAALYGIEWFAAHAEWSKLRLLCEIPLAGILYLAIVFIY